MIELVTTLIMVSVIGAFAGFFLYNGINGYLASKRNSEAALKAQVVLDRLSAELRHISSLPENPVTNSFITYKTADSKLPGTRKIRYEASTQTIYLSIDPGAGIPISENPLLDQVESFTLAWDSADLDNTTGNEISAIRIEFALKEMGTKFGVRIYPRVFIASPT